MNTTYTLIKRCMKKGAIERTEPGFLCHALLPKAAVQEAETDKLINKIYDGSADKLFAALLGSGAFTMPTWAWIALGVPMLAIFVVAMRYGDRIESWLFEKFRKISGRKR